MISFRLKAVRAFAGALMVVGVAGGLVVGCDSGVVTERSALPNEQSAVAKQTSAKQFTPEQIAEMSVANRQLESMSIVIAKTLADENMRGWVYSKCMKKFDGVTNVLRQQLAADRSRKRYKFVHKNNLVNLGKVIEK